MMPTPGGSNSIVESSVNHYSSAKLRLTVYLRLMKILKNKSVNNKKLREMPLFERTGISEKIELPKHKQVQRNVVTKNDYLTDS